jgi:hypothetical protein
MNHTPTTWRKSTYSISTQNCVELATTGDHVLMRDSKRAEAGHLTFNRGAVAALVASAKAGHLDNLV